jgi:hypothetical protein
MTNRLSILLLFALFALQAWTQFERPDVWYSVGYQYADFGNSLSPATVRMYNFNRSLGPDDKPFENSRHAYGLFGRIMIKGENGFATELSISNKKVISNASHIDSLGVETDVRTKQRLRSFNIGLHYTRSRFTAGITVDLGAFASFIRYKGGSASGKYYPWFYAPKIFGSGYTAKSPVIGCTISAGAALSKHVDARIYKQFTAFGMGGDLSDRYFSLSNWGVELALTFGK